MNTLTNLLMDIVKTKLNEHSQKLKYLFYKNKMNEHSQKLSEQKLSKTKWNDILKI
jgi:hypothetical protein